MNRYKNCSNFLEYDFPNVSNYYTQGTIFGSVMCIQKENQGFDFYLLRVNDKGQISCEDFQIYFKEVYAKAAGLISPHNAFILYLLQLANLYCKGKSNFDIYLHNGVLVKAHLSENNKYWLEMLYDYKLGLINEDVLNQTGYNKPIFNKAQCFCRQEFFHSDEHIPDGEQYDVECPYCKALLKKKKLTNSK